MSVENPLWGAPRIHGELKLSFSVAQSSVAKYMVKWRGSGSRQYGRTRGAFNPFLNNSAEKSVLAVVAPDVTVYKIWIYAKNATFAAALCSHSVSP